MDRDAYLLALCRCVERKPVAAGLVASAAAWPSGLRQQVFLGDESFVERTLDRLQSVRGRTRKTDGVPQGQTRRPASLDRLLAEAADRDQAVLEADRDAGFTMTEIARHLGLSVSRVSRLIARGRGKRQDLTP